MNYRRSRQSKRSNRSNRYNRTNRSRRNRRGGAMDNATLIRAYNNWASRNGPGRVYPLANGFTLEGGHIILTERRTEEDGANNRMVARYNTTTKSLEIISGNPDQADLAANIPEEQIYALARNE